MSIEAVGNAKTILPNKQSLIDDYNHQIVKNNTIMVELNNDLTKHYSSLKNS